MSLNDVDSLPRISLQWTAELSPLIIRFSLTGHCPLPAYITIRIYSYMYSNTFYSAERFYPSRPNNGLDSGFVELGAIMWFLSDVIIPELNSASLWNNSLHNIWWSYWFLTGYYFNLLTTTFYTSIYHVFLSRSLVFAL